MITVWVNGTFDVLTIAHIRLLTYARSLGDELIVGIDTDERVKEKKGKGRPVNSCKVRKEFLEALSCVTKVREFGTDSHLEHLLRAYSPDIMVIGDDWRDKKIVGVTFCKEVIFFKHIEGYSTSAILKHG